MQPLCAALLSLTPPLHISPLQSFRIFKISTCGQYNETYQDFEPILGELSAVV